jgi:tetratricopeptide (TPR) repeat protein
MDFVRDAYRKRAYANLTAGRFDVAMEDALASCPGEDLDAKAAYCSGRAAYELGLYEDSRDYFGRALKLNPNNPRCRKDLNRALSRIEEQDLGNYDFKSMGESLSITNVHMDHANFLRNVEIRDTGTHGRGLYATRDLERGNLVLCEKALCFPNMLKEDLHNSETTLYNFNTNTRTEGAAQGALFLSLVQVS